MIRIINMNNFEDSVRKWVRLDDEVRRATEHMRQLREERNNVAESIHSYVNTNKLENAVINISDGRLRFVETQTTQTLTYKFLEKCLEEIIPNTESVTNILTYIKSKRYTKSAPDIKRYFSD